MIAEKIDVPAERRHVGFDAYRQVIASCDVVLLCTPPGFRPLHLRAAVDANKHVFAEKPVAVDAAGVRSVLVTCEEARRRNLSLVSGLCLRYDNGYRDTVRRIRDGVVGSPMTLHANDQRGAIWSRPRAKRVDRHAVANFADWYYFTWLSGDFNVEQHVHNLDVCAWIMGDRYPVRCYGSGGRQVRTAPEFGHIFDHFSVVYEYENGAKLLSHTRQQAGCRNEICVQVQGTSGKCHLTDGRRRGLTLKTATGDFTYDGPLSTRCTKPS